MLIKNNNYFHKIRQISMNSRLLSKEKQKNKFIFWNAICNAINFTVPIKLFYSRHFPIRNIQTKSVNTASNYTIARMIWYDIYIYNACMHARFIMLRVRNPIESTQLFLSKCYLLISACRVAEPSEMESILVCFFCSTVFAYVSM